VSSIDFGSLTMALNAKAQGEGLFTFTERDALPPNVNDCKARDDAKGGSLGEERNEAGAVFGGNPKGRGVILAHRGVARRLFGITKRHSSRLALHPKLPPSR
jgi:hypothetical protein